jgi:hypothetical protein
LTWLALKLENVRALVRLHRAPVRLRRAERKT